MLSACLETLGIAVIEVEADGSVEHLSAYIQGSAEFVGGLGFLRQFRRDGFVGLVVSRKELQDCRILRPFFEHLGWGLDEIIFQVAH